MLFRSWRPEPTYVEKCGDEVWVRVKSQSNMEIAGSLRNSFRASLKRRSIGGRALIELGALKELPNSVKLRMPMTFFRSEEHTSELQSRGHLVCRLLLEKKNKTKNKVVTA